MYQAMSRAMTLFELSSHLATYRAFINTKHFMMRSRIEVMLTYPPLRLTWILRRRINEGKALIENTLKNFL